MKRINSTMGMLAVAAAVVLGGCSSKAVFQQPEVSLAGARVGGVGLKGGLIYVQLHVDNPNGYQLRANRLTYDFDLKDTNAQTETWARLAQGNVDQDIKVGGHSSATIEIPIEFNYSGAGGAVKSVLDRGTMNYRVTGSVNVTEPISRMIPFSRTGVASLAGIH
jgi:LEA14-like dessication related protein